MADQIHLKTVMIANGASLSDAVDLYGFTVKALLVPAAWTAAPVSFAASFDNGSFGDCFNQEGAEYMINIGASRLIPLSLSALFDAGRYFKLRSGTAAVPVNQGAARILTLLLVPV